MQGYKKIFLLFVRLCTMLWEEVCGRDISTCSQRHNFKVFWTQQKRDTFQLQKSIKIIPLLCQPGLLVDLYLHFSLLCLLFEHQKSLLLAIWKGQESERGYWWGAEGSGEEAVISGSVKSFPLPLSSHVPSEQANFLYYSFLKKESFVFSFFTSLQPFA